MKLEDIHIGDRLLWTDPDRIDDLPNQPYEVTVTSINGEIVCCEFDKTENGCYGAVEAFAHELEMKANGKQEQTSEAS